MGRRKKPKQRSRKTSMEDLPIDVAFDILQRLPITSFLSVKLVCKYFYRLASHPDLVSHYHHIHKNPWLIIRTSWYIIKPYCTQLYLVDSQRRFTEIVQPWMTKEYIPGPMLSTNGLLCVLLYERNSLDSYRVCLFNPLTGEHDFLNHPGFPIVLGSRHVFGFGFNAKTEQYKLVRIVSFMDGGTCKAEAFALRKNGGQTQITKIEPPFACPGQSSDVVVGGAIHWLCPDKNTTRYEKPTPKSILSYDLFEEKFHQMATPEPDCEASRCCKISVLEGCLAIVDDFFNYGRSEVHIWLLKEYGVKESWTKQFKIGEIEFRRFYPLVLLNSGKILMSDKWNAISCYDPEKDCCEDYVRLDQPVVTICHVPSLVSPFL